MGGESCLFDRQNMHSFSWGCPRMCQDSLLCINGTCISPNLADGCSCATDTDCWLDGIRSFKGTMKVCISGQCITPYQYGTPCTTGKECRSEICDNNVCAYLSEGEV